MANKDNKQMSEYELEVDQEISHELVANEVRRQEVVENRKKLELLCKGESVFQY